MLPVRFSSYWSRLQQVPGADGSLVRWGIVCIVGIFLWFMLLEPWGSTIQGEREMLSSRVMEAARMQALQSQTDVWREAQQRFRKAVAQASQGLLQADTATAAQSELQGLLQGMVNRHHLKLESQRFMPVVNEPGIGKRVAIQLRLIGPMADAYRFLDSLARHDRLLVIEKLTLGRRSAEDMGLVVQVAGFMAVQEEKL